MTFSKHAQFKWALKCRRLLIFVDGHEFFVNPVCLVMLYAIPIILVLCLLSPCRRSSPSRSLPFMFGCFSVLYVFRSIYIFGNLIPKLRIYTVYLAHPFRASDSLFPKQDRPNWNAHRPFAYIQFIFRMKCPYTHKCEVPHLRSRSLAWCASVLAVRVYCWMLAVPACRDPLLFFLSEYWNLILWADWQWSRQQQQRPQHQQQRAQQQQQQQQLGPPLKQRRQPCWIEPSGYAVLDVGGISMTSYTKHTKHFMARKQNSTHIFRDLSQNWERTRNKEAMSYSNFPCSTHQKGFRRRGKKQKIHWIVSENKTTQLPINNNFLSAIWNIWVSSVKKSSSSSKPSKKHFNWMTFVRLITNYNQLYRMNGIVENRKFNPIDDTLWSSG